MTAHPVAALGARLRARRIGFRLAEPSDAGFIHALRTDPAKSTHLSETRGDAADQRRWLEDYKRREALGAEYYFVIEAADGRPCGVVRLYDFRGASFCWGSWVLADWAPRTAAIESAVLVYETGFGPLGFTQSHFAVRKGNERVWRFHERMGASRVGSTERDHLYRYGRDRYLAVRPRYARFLLEIGASHLIGS